jgi:hypothetical protein
MPEFGKLQPAKTEGQPETGSHQQNQHRRSPGKCPYFSHYRIQRFHMFSLYLLFFHSTATIETHLIALQLWA